MYWKSWDLNLFGKSAQCCRFLICVTCSVACCASCWYQYQSKNWHSWSQGREDFWHQIMSSVLSWPPAIQTLPCRCISAFTFQWQQPPNPGTGTSAQNLTRCSRNPCGSHHSWFLSRGVELRFLLAHQTLKTVQRSNPGLNGKGRKVVPWKYLHTFILKNTLFSLQIMISYPCHRSQTGIWHCSQTLSTPILTAPNEDHLLVYMVMALLKTAQEPSCGHSSLSDSAEAVWV